MISQNFFKYMISLYKWKDIWKLNRHTFYSENISINLPFVRFICRVDLYLFIGIDSPLSVSFLTFSICTVLFISCFKDFNINSCLRIMAYLMTQHERAVHLIINDSSSWALIFYTWQVRKIVLMPDKIQCKHLY